MGSYNKNKGRNNSGRFVKLDYWLLDSLAWQSLSHTARALYIIFKQRYNGSNNGQIHMSVREAKDVLSCAPGTASKAIQELVDRGFIQYRFKGKFSHRVHRASEFILTEHKCHDCLATKDFMKWRPEQ